jgi:hypothetical protein
MPKGDWTDICRRIKEGSIIPVIGNAVRNDGIFDWWLSASGIGTANGPEPGLSVDEFLAQEWSAVIGYPLLDTTNLARVALYNRARSKDPEEAKVNYLQFLKQILLVLADKDPVVRDQVPALEKQIGRLSFSELVIELDYPRFTPEREDPLRCLARMPLPIYITTSYYDFMERALEAAEKSPRTQICFGLGEPANLDPDHKTRHDLVPSVKEPVVYHLFGWERYPSTMVLSEADYLDYLMRIIQDTNTSNPIIPLYMQSALKASTLILMGYRMQDWDFRVLFRLIRQSEQKRFAMLVQMNPEQLAGNLKSSEVRSYLEDFFRGIFSIHWGNPDEFVYRLCAEYKKWTETEV